MKFEEKCQVDENPTVATTKSATTEKILTTATWSRSTSRHGFYSGNTFYKMQILRERVRDVYILFTRWGRVGTQWPVPADPLRFNRRGQEGVLLCLQTKYRQPVGRRHSFAKVREEVPPASGDEKDQGGRLHQGDQLQGPRIPSSHLHKAIYKLIRRICNYKVIINAVKLSITSNSILPLQSLTKERLADADTLLNGIQNALKATTESRKN